MSDHGKTEANQLLLSKLWCAIVTLQYKSYDTIDLHNALYMPISNVTYNQVMPLFEKSLGLLCVNKFRTATRVGDYWFDQFGKSVL